MQQVRSITDGVYWVGALNPGLRIFDVIMNTDWGTTYNSYLVKSQKAALIDACHADFAPEFMAKVSSVTDLATLEYIIIQHTEMDHTGALAELLKAAPNAEVWGTKSALHLLKNITNMEFKSHAVTDREELDLGDGVKLTFIPSPFWHWPDSMFTYLTPQGILFSCDGFAAHYCDERLFNDRVPDFTRDAKYYFDHIMRPFKDKVPPGCQKVKSLQGLKMICPSHGPILRDNPMRTVDLWEKWSTPAPKDGKEAAIFYVSAYGATRTMAEKIAEGFETGGVKTTVADLLKVSIEEVLDLIERSDAILLGTPTLNGDAVKPLWDVLAYTALVNTKGKKWGAFGSYGWSGEGPKLLEERMKGLKFSVFEERLLTVLIPSEDEKAKCVEFGQRCASAIGASK